MAIICRQLRLLFVQAPRTGCTAVAQLLLERFDGEQLPREDILGADGNIDIPRKHCTIEQLRRGGLMPGNDTSSWLTFTAVRNPFDSLASLYVKKREKYQPLLADPTAWIHRVPGYVDDMEFCRTHSFDEWLEKHYGIGLIGRQLGRGQRSLYERYTRGVARVIRFERLQADFEAVMRESGAIGDVQIPLINPTVQRAARYQSYYTPRSRRLVEYVFQPDFERYGYSFDGLREPSAELAP